MTEQKQADVSHFASAFGGLEATSLQAGLLAVPAQVLTTEDWFLARPTQAWTLSSMVLLALLHGV